LKELKTQLKGPGTANWLLLQVETCLRLYNYTNIMNNRWEISPDLMGRKFNEIEDNWEPLLPMGPLQANKSNNELVQEVIGIYLEIKRKPRGHLA
jgi:hypothetical protein